MASECSVLRLLPISGGIFAGNFLEEMPSLTWRAIGLAFARLPRQAQDALLEPIEGGSNNDDGGDDGGASSSPLLRRRVDLCIFSRSDMNKFAAAGFPRALEESLVDDEDTADDEDDSPQGEPPMMFSSTTSAPGSKSPTQQPTRPPPPPEQQQQQQQQQQQHQHQHQALEVSIVDGSVRKTSDGNPFASPPEETGGGNPFDTPLDGRATPVHNPFEDDLSLSTNNSSYITSASASESSNSSESSSSAVKTAASSTPSSSSSSSSSSDGKGTGPSPLWSGKQRPRTAMALFEPLSPKSPLSPTNARNKMRPGNNDDEVNGKDENDDEGDDEEQNSDAVRDESLPPLPSQDDGGLFKMSPSKMKKPVGGLLRRRGASSNDVTTSVKPALNPLPTKTGDARKKTKNKKREQRQQEPSLPNSKSRHAFSLNDVSKLSAARLMAYARTAASHYNIQKTALRTSVVVFVEPRPPAESFDAVTAAAGEVPPWQKAPTRVWLHVRCLMVVDRSACHCSLLRSQ